MPLLGSAAIVIWTEISAEMLEEHDRWHSTEHLPERLGIPGFLRGRRCAALDPLAPLARFILYELHDIGVATSAPYLERLNNPTVWSRRIMAASRLTRALCRIDASHGESAGGMLVTAALAARPNGFEQLARAPGVAAAHLLQRDAAITRPTTNEEKLRKGGGDASVDWVVVLEGEDAAKLLEAAGRVAAGKTAYALSQTRSRVE